MTMPTRDELFAGLRRAPDVEAPNLFAVDAADRLILDTAAGALASMSGDHVVVVGDHYGALTLGAVVEHGLSGLRVHQDLVTGEQASIRNATAVGLSDRFEHCALDGDLFRAARVVLMQLPRTLAELAEIADTAATFADPGVQVFAGGRDKHITPAMNDVLRQRFEHVQASRGRQKSRVLSASGPIVPSQCEYPVTATLDDLDMTVVAHGGAFAGAKLDIGTRALLKVLSLDHVARSSVVVDLGCGTGVLAVHTKRRRPDLRVVGTDRSAAAVRSTEATAAANGVDIEVVRDDAMASFDGGSVDLILCNPPFHLGAAVHTGGATKMFEAAARVLRPGGAMWTVYNSHLGYRGALTRTVGPTDVRGRTGKFTVVRSSKVVRPVD